MAEILNIMIENNISIRGVCVGVQALKMVQFANDTTLLLDESQSSFQTALNIMELLGSLSGLKMTTEKTKTIWIGSKKHCKEKLNISANLHWEDTEFSFLGTDFSVYLENIPS